MRKFKNVPTARLTVIIGGSVLALGLIWPLMGIAQVKSNKATDPDPHAQHKDKQPADDQNLGGQKQGSAWWFDNYTRGQRHDLGGKGMAHGEAGMGGMTGMTKDKMDAGSMARDSGSSGMGMKDGVDLMGMMDGDLGLMGVIAIGGTGSKSMKALGEMKMVSSLPGSPGVSHIYHIGATGFFLNHSEHITLSTKQQAALNVIKQKALLSKFTAQRKIDEAEQELWELTGADEPDAAEIEAQIQEIEKLRGKQRMVFIQSVGEAAKVLTDEQRQMLLGATEPDATTGK